MNKVNIINNAKTDKETQKLLILIILMFGLSICLYYRSGEKSSQIPQSKLQADSSDGASQIFMIDASTEDVTVKNFEIEISPIDYSDDELEYLVVNNLDSIYEKILMGNEGFDLVTDDLDFFDSIDGLPFDFEWNPQDISLIGYEGELLSAEPFDTSIYLIISYKSFSYDISIDIHADPGMLAKRKLKELELQNFISENILNAVNNDENLLSVQLPGNMDGKEITYYYSERKRNPLYLMLGPITSVFLIFASKYDKEKEQKDRIQKIMSEYPGMVQKMALYLTSGMTIRNVWIKLCEENGKGNKSPLYSEMQISANELGSSVSESLVYLRFGKRIGNTEIVRFSALLSQNIKKGSLKLSSILNEEAEKAFEQRKLRAIQKGEEAGTKLLFPMMLFLLDVLVIIMIPAFWNM